MRTIILMLDLDSTLFWQDGEGGRVDESALPISEALKKRMHDYYAHFAELYYRDHHPRISDMDRRLLDGAGLEIWQQLRQELDGLYRVLFFSEEFSDAFDSPAQFIVQRKNAYAS
jgi:hypothetical protein